MPVISVIMSTYNEENYIKQSLDSILKQSEQNFEVILIDDCSTDKTVQIIQNIHDKRIKLICNKENYGLTRNLNMGLELAKGKYIARMDGDDISLPERFAKQIKFFEEHPDVMLISCQTQNFGDSTLYWKLKESSEELKARMLVRPVFAHPGFMLRRELIDRGYRYDETFRTAQDYELVSRVAERYPIGIVQEVLLHYRVHEKQVSNLVSKEQFNNADRVREKLWYKTGVQLSGNEKKLLQYWAKEERADSVIKYIEVNRLIDKILAANKDSYCYQQEVLERTLNRLLYIWVIRSKKIGFLLAFPRICRYQRKNMVIFVKEFMKIIKEKIGNSASCCL